MIVSKYKNEISFTFGEKDFYQKATLIRNFNTAYIYNSLPIKTLVYQIIFKYGYSEATVKKYQSKGIELPEYYFKSDVVNYLLLTPKKTRNTKKTKSLTGMQLTKQLQIYTADKIENDYEYYHDAMEYDLVHNLRAVYFRSLSIDKIKK